MRPNASIVADALLIGVAFLTIVVSLERNFLFVSSATVALQTTAETVPTTASDFAKTSTTTTSTSTTDRYPKLYAENDNYGKHEYTDFYQFAITSIKLTAFENYCRLRSPVLDIHTK